MAIENVCLLKISIKPLQVSDKPGETHFVCFYMLRRQQEKANIGLAAPLLDITDPTHKLRKTQNQGAFQSNVTFIKLPLKYFSI